MNNQSVILKTPQIQTGFKASSAKRHYKWRNCKIKNAPEFKNSTFLLHYEADDAVVYVITDLARYKKFTVEAYNKLIANGELALKEELTLKKHLAMQDLTKKFLNSQKFLNSLKDSAASTSNTQSSL